MNVRFGWKADIAPPLHLRHIARVIDTEKHVAEAEADLRRARELLSGSGRYDSYDWLLLATLIGEADLVLREARKQIPRLHVPLLDEVREELRTQTSNFTDDDFLRSSRAARRRNPELFRPLA